jgi:hypothetical protein
MERKAHTAADGDAIAALISAVKNPPSWVTSECNRALCGLVDE